MSRCPRCRATVTRGGTCPRCPQPAPLPVVPGRALAARLRTPTATSGAPRSVGAVDTGWTITGQVIREEATQAAAAFLTRPLTWLAVLTPWTILAAAGGLPVAPLVIGAIEIAVIVVLLLVMVPFLGLGWLATLLTRTAVGAITAGAVLANRRPAVRTGRLLIVRTPAGDRRVLAATDLTYPVGTEVSVTGPRWAGVQHCWAIRSHALDGRALLTRGVATMVGAFIVGTGSTVALLALIVAAALR